MSLPTLEHHGKPEFLWDPLKISLKVRGGYALSFPLSTTDKVNLSEQCSSLTSKRLFEMTTVGTQIPLISACVEEWSKPSPNTQIEPCDDRKHF